MDFPRQSYRRTCLPPLGSVADRADVIEAISLTVAAARGHDAAEEGYE